MENLFLENSKNKKDEFYRKKTIAKIFRHLDARSLGRMLIVSKNTNNIAEQIARDSLKSKYPYLHHSNIKNPVRELYELERMGRFSAPALGRFANDPVLAEKYGKNRSSPFLYWLAGDELLPKIYLNKEKTEYKVLSVSVNDIDFDQAFITFEYVYSLHQADKITKLGKSFKKSRTTMEKYVADANRVVPEADSVHLDWEETDEILDANGKPPKFSYNIYLITVGKGEHERVVYCGMTCKDTHRFRNGHKASQKLTDSKYDNLERKIYLGLVLLLYKDTVYNRPAYKSMPLEWIEPIELADTLLDSIESQLIFWFNPELNVDKKKTYCANPRYEFKIITLAKNLKNSRTSEESKFLQGECINDFRRPKM